MTTCYTHGHEAPVLQAHSSRTVQSSASYLVPHLKPDMSLLDLGCGPGSITRGFREYTSQVTGVDFSADALVVAKAADSLSQYVQADIYSLPFDDDSFDVVHAHQVLQHLKDPVAALVEMQRVAKPGGIIAFRDADYEAMAWYPYPSALKQWQELYSKFARKNGGEPNAGRFLRKWALLAGLKDIQVSATNWTYASTEVCLKHGLNQAERIRSVSFRTQAAAFGIEDIEPLARAWEQWGEDSAAWHIVPSTEILAVPGLTS